MFAFFYLKCYNNGSFGGTSVRTDDFDYELPEELIAQEPIEKRDESRLMVLDKKTGEIARRTAHTLNPVPFIIYDPEFKNVDVYFNSDIPKKLKAHASYTPSRDAIDFVRSKAHGGLLDHELTHRAELYGNKTTPTRLFYLADEEIKNGVPYNSQKAEINANIAQATSDDKTRSEVIKTLNKIYQYGRPNNIMEVYTRAGN